MKLPGDYLATSEEFAPGRATFERDGKIYSAIVGKEYVDEKRAMSVQGKRVRPLEKGDEVYAVIHDIYEAIALVKFQPVQEHVGTSNSSAFLRISEIMRGYVERFRDHLRIGDVLQARIVDITPLAIYITINAPELGVIKASCSRCRGEMKREGRMFVCKECFNRESRKAAEMR